MLSGEPLDSKAVDVMYLISGKSDGVEDNMNRVPLAMYMLRKSVHPGACEIIDVSGRRATELMRVGGDFDCGASISGMAGC